MGMPQKYEGVKCKTALDNVGFLGTRFWTRHAFDPYINCEINCVYCGFGALKRESGREFSAPIYPKINAPQVLDHELTMLKRRGVVSLGGATDVYQPAEEKYRITRQLIEVLMKHNCPFAIGTKSDLILRDLDLLREAALKNWCTVSITITTLDENMAKLLEPNAPSPKRRLRALKKLSDNGIMTGVWLSPVLPYITDSKQNISDVIGAAVENGAKYVLGCGLDMRDASRLRMFLEKNFKTLMPKYEALYEWKEKPKNHYPGEPYLYDFYKQFIIQCQKHGVESFIPHFHTRRQAWLFYVRNFSKFKGTPVFEATQLLNYLSPSKEMLQTINLRWGKSATCKKFLKTAGYFPH
jgi:DNA repair photolyase